MTYYVYKTVACPAGQTGSITYTCKWLSDAGNNCIDKYFPGRGDWASATVSSSCVLLAPTYVSTKSETQKVLCPSSAPVGVITQSRSYEVWSDGTNKNYTAWVTTINTCKAIPEQTLETKDGSEEVSCDSYYGVPAGSYSGSVYKYGEYVSIYDAGTMTTNTVFNVKSIDVTSCASEISELSTEYKTEDCLEGRSGSIKYYRYKAINSKFETIYPYGDWAVLENSCISQGSQDDDTPITSGDKSTGLLENLYFTSSDIIKNGALSSYLKTLSAGNWSATEKHKLTINIDDLSSGKYNATNISGAISKFQSTVGVGNAEVKLILPRSLDRLVGNGDITSAAVSNKSIVLKNIQLNGVNAVITYLDLKTGSSIEMPKEKVATVNILGNGLDISKISAQ